MGLNFNLLWEHLKCCLWCGSFFKSPGNPFCEVCFNAFKTKYIQPKLNARSVKGLTSFVLFDWPPDNPFLIKFMAHLKGQSQEFEWKFLAKLFRDRMVLSDNGIFLNSRNKKVLFIPPPRLNNIKDHGYFWSIFLSEYWNAEMVDCLAKVPEISQDLTLAQKAKNRMERSTIEFRSNRDFENPEDILFVFADDIITTGSTASAAFFALGCPKNFMVFALSYRALLV